MRHADLLPKRAVLGLAGLATVLGATACQSPGSTPEPAAGKAPVAATSSPPAEQQVVGSVQGMSAPERPMGPVAPKSTSERLSDARGANERLGTTVRRPREKAPTAVDPSKVRRVEIGSVQKDKHLMRIVSSKQDLSGYAELAWVADNGEPHGDANCSRMIQVSDSPPKAKPTLLICWRLTPKKSVYTVAVDLRTNPTAKASVTALDREWKRMGS
ncbi:hypothetical protein [Actinoplanes sp. HUAS TT8]|uniref:hypothetical protein n=1 Tax=Actinoplanes sp. HUAS TT8 TaxID=3447453 RepID=UPI003F526AED